MEDTGTWPDLGGTGPSDGFDFGASAPATTRSERKSRKHHRGGPRGGDSHSPEFGRPNDGRTGSGGFGAGLGGEQPIEHLEALIEAEKNLVQVLRLDTDELDEELHRLEEIGRLEDRETARERSECDRIGQERKHLEQQLEASKRQLGELKLEHEGLHLEAIMLRRDRGHYGAQTSFLQKLFDEGSRDVQALQRSVEYLEQSNQSLAAHTQSLEEARKEILEQVRTEKELLRKEEMEAQSAKQALETLRGTGGDRLARFGGTRPASLADDGFGFGPSVLDDPGPGRGGGGSEAGGFGSNFGSNFGGSASLGRGNERDSANDTDGFGVFPGGSGGVLGASGAFPGTSAVVGGHNFQPQTRTPAVLPF